MSGILILCGAWFGWESYMAVTSITDMVFDWRWRK